MKGANPHKPGTRAYAVARCANEIRDRLQMAYWMLRHEDGMSPEEADSAIAEAMDRVHTELTIARADWLRYRPPGEQ